MSRDLELSVDRASEVPLGTQLIWKLRMLIATGELSPGAKLPGIRELAELAGVNVNTVRSVVSRLEEQGLLVTEHGRGNFVADTARRNASLAGAAEAAISHAHAVGISPRELAAVLYVTSLVASGPAVATEAEPEAGVASVPSIDDRTQRQRLRSEIKRLELELAEIEPLSPIEQRRSGPAARFLDTAELIEVHEQLAARLNRLRRERRAWRAEAQHVLDAERDLARSRARRWRTGRWTGQSGAAVSWTTA